MSDVAEVTIFGEVLFDCFEDGRSVLGGAPFNVAWHLQAMSDAPRFISRIGDDALGKQITTAMQQWGMSTRSLQRDKKHPTGKVLVEIKADEPHYDIAQNVAYDFIDYGSLRDKPRQGLFYHGTLAARNAASAASLQRLTETVALDIFVDVNLRDPWWQKAATFEMLEKAKWVKLNHHELAVLGFKSADIEQDMTRLHNHFHLSQLIVTCGEEGAIVRDEHGEFHQIKPVAAQQLVDTVGAGDAFTAMYIHGLLHDWPVEQTLDKAQRFASKVVGIRGALTQDRAFYQDI